MKNKEAPFLRRVGVFFILQFMQREKLTIGQPNAPGTRDAPAL